MKKLFLLMFFPLFAQSQSISLPLEIEIAEIANNDGCMWSFPLPNVRTSIQYNRIENRYELLDEHFCVLRHYVYNAFDGSWSAYYGTYLLYSYKRITPSYIWECNEIN